MQPLESNHTYANIAKIEGILSSGFSLDKLANICTNRRAGSPLMRYKGVQHECPSPYARRLV